MGTQDLAGGPRMVTLSLPAGWQEAPGSISALLQSIIGDLCQAQRFDLRFFRPFRADLSIRKSSSFFPPLIAATSQRGLAPRPAQVSPDGPRYFGGTFLPFKTLRPPRTTLRPPTKAIALSILPNCARCGKRAAGVFQREYTPVSNSIDGETCSIMKITTAHA
jgi:hypothetical protein